MVHLIDSQSSSDHSIWDEVKTVSQFEANIIPNLKPFHVIGK